MHARETTLPRPRWDVCLWLAIVAAVNVALFTGNPASWAVFRPEAVLRGEWWRVITHPFAHVSMYHLLLDAGAFFMLYAGIKRSSGWRVACASACGAGSLLAAMATPAIATAGFCGLSGIGHGLMAVAGVELTAGGRGGRAYRAGLVVLALVVLKSAYEALTGHVFFESGHVGDVGTPLVFCHAGGVIGGLLFCLVGGSGTER